ncbi:methyltransferase domain-containing protein, partial [bacterium]|nr:methyltransferase domain-containing protein [bacterium]
MKNPWDERYRDERYFYGTAPNALVAEALRGLPPGRGLYAAEGEGRNAVHAAGLGHAVVAFDSSVEGRRKALEMAAERGVEIDYLLCDAESPLWEDAAPFDHVVLCFFHTRPELRSALHARFAASLRSGGRLIVVSFAKEQLGRGTGGPPDLGLLHGLGEIRAGFPG